MNDLISLPVLHRMCYRIRNDRDYALSFIKQPLSRTGRPLTYDEYATVLIIQMRLESNRLKYSNLYQNFNTLYHGRNVNINRGSVSTLRRVVVKAKITRKTIVRIHRLRNNMDGYDFLQRVAHVHPDLWVDIDEMKSTPKDFLERYGYSPSGEECYKLKIVIGTQSFSVIAAMVRLGFIYWDIREGKNF